MHRPHSPATLQAVTSDSLRNAPTGNTFRPRFIHHFPAATRAVSTLSYAVVHFVSAVSVFSFNHKAAYLIIFSSISCRPHVPTPLPL